MDPLDISDLTDGALVLVDSAPIIYVLEGQPKFGPRFKPLFEAHAAGRLRFAVTTMTVAELLTGPLKAADDALARRYRRSSNRGNRLRSTSTLQKAQRNCGLRSG